MLTEGVKTFVCVWALSTTWRRAVTQLLYATATNANSQQIAHSLRETVLYLETIGTEARTLNGAKQYVVSECCTLLPACVMCRKCCCR